MSKKTTVHVIYDENLGIWKAQFIDGNGEQIISSEFELEEHARIEAGVYKEYFELYDTNAKYETKRAGVWENVVQIMRERGMVV